jgi:hypothetical protein
MTAELAEVTSAAKAQEYPVGRHPRSRGVPTCTAQACAQVALDGGLCPAHRRAVKLTAEISDAVFHFFAGNRNIGDAIRPGTRNDNNFVEAGECLSLGIALLIGSLFDGDVVFCEESPIFADTSFGTRYVPKTPRWRVKFSWAVE